MTCISFQKASGSGVQPALYTSNYGLLGSVEILGGARSNWTSARHAVTFPGNIPVEIPDMGYYRQTQYLTFDGYIQAVKGLLRIWFDYLMSISATVNGYNRALSEYDQGYNQIKNTVETSGPGGNPAYYATKYQWYKITSQYQIYKDKLLARAQEIVIMQQKMQAAETVYEMAKSYYDELIKALGNIHHILDAATAWQAWEAMLAQRGDESAAWAKWKVQLAVAPDLLKEVGDLRKIYQTNFPVVQANVEEKRRSIAIQEEKTYGEVAVTTKMRTGLFAKSQMALQEITTAQVTEAINIMDAFITQLKPALGYRDIGKVQKVYETIVPKAKAFYLGLSMAVRNDARFRAKLSEYNNIVTKLEGKMGAFKEGPNWGLILGIGAAAVGTMAFLS